MSDVSSPQKTALPILMLGALGVVYGDIGTSPLYAVKETVLSVSHHGGDAVGMMMGLLSTLFWLLTIVVTLKYVALTLYADNKGEGGDFSLLALNLKLTAQDPIFHYFIGLVGILGGCLFYADAVITPAISVLSAVEGLHVYYAGLKPYIIPATLTILILLFCIQRFGAGRMGAMFGPIMFIWFVTIGLLGFTSIVETPNILWALDPLYAIDFITHHPLLAFFAGGAIVLVVTGAEALYADMGHFGRLPIQLSWVFVFFCLTLNYFGQGALILRAPEILMQPNFNPFYMLAPEGMVVPLVTLATLATTIAAQSTISGAFSLTRQAIQLGYLPRMRILHTSFLQMGQIYIPFVNWVMLSAVIFVVVLFKTTSGLAGAYGIAVTGAMFLTTIAIGMVMRRRWQWPVWVVAPVILFFGGVEATLLAANMMKIDTGGWLPITVALVLFMLLTTWFRGQRILYETLNTRAHNVRDFADDLVKENYRRVPGTAVYMTPRKHLVPEPLLVNLKYNKILHERIILLTIMIGNDPTVPDDERVDIQELAENFYRITLRYGFVEEPNLERTLATCAHDGVPLLDQDTVFILGRESIVPTPGKGMAIWREHIYAWMKRNAGSAVDFYRVPPGRVLEIGGQYEI